MDTMTYTKIAGGLCGAFLVFLLGKWAAEEIYHTGGHYGAEQAYVIDTGEEETSDEPAEEINFMAMMASAEVDKGAGVFRKCSACHKLEDGANGTGPHLYAVVGRDIAAVDGFSYSEALAGIDGVWDAEALSGFLEDPKGWAPGTNMGFAGLKKPEDRANLIAYLDGLDGEMTDYAAAAAAAAPATDAAASEETSSEEASEDSSSDAATDESSAEDATDESATEDSATQTAMAGDAANGEKVFRKCRACHKLEDGANGVGPHLYAVVGRDIAGIEGFNFSDALLGLEGNWTPEALDGFLENPKEYAPGTKMGFAGLKKADDRADVIAYLNGNGN